MQDVTIHYKISKPTKKKHNNIPAAGGAENTTQ